MALIRIIAGTYGFRENGMIHPKDRNSGAFEVDNKEAERLIALKVAEIAAEQPCISSKGVTPTTGENADSEPVCADTEEDDYVEYEYDETTPVNKLREIGKQLGLSFPIGTTKADMIAGLDKALEEEGPDIGAAEPVEEE